MRVNGFKFYNAKPPCNKIPDGADANTTFGEITMRPVLYSVIIFSLFAAATTVPPVATAQNVAAASCASFKRADKDPAQQAVFLAYLQGYANASSPDPRYVPSDAALADYTKNVRDWCGKNPKSTYAEAVAAVLPSPAQSAPAGMGPVYAQPASCRVGPTTYCAGCAVTCNPPKQAKCTPGRDSQINQWCGQQSRCLCQ